MGIYTNFDIYVYASKECKFHQKLGFMMPSIKIWDRFSLQPGNFFFDKWSLELATPALNSDYKSVAQLTALPGPACNYKWATSWQNQQNGMYAQRRLRSAWASAQSDIRVFAVRMKEPWVLSYPLSAQRRLWWSDWADAQADLSHCWAHRPFVGFVMRRLK